jgi:uroporphyrinogen III methyltransferase/synthase
VRKGKVFLVGAGPGDPGLLTLKGREVLERAEVVVYDYLANEALLEFVPPCAERIYVGKKGGDHTVGQDRISEILAEKGKDNIVVRLKGGDPFVFGRGGEEAQVLVSAGVPFEIVPGVTAAIAVPAYAGIPLSHRDYSASMAFVTGHEREDTTNSKIAWDKLATGVGTLVFFMGVKNLPEIRGKLLEYGRPPATPVAVIRWGTTPDQTTVTGTLEDIVEKVRQAGLKPPAITVVGEVVRLRNELNWFESRPLFGRRIVVTRAREQASSFKAILSGLGARCIEFPTIDIQPPPSWEQLDAAVAGLSDYHWAIFTSVNGVRFFMERLHVARLDSRAFSGTRIAAIGPKTAEALGCFGLKPDLVPEEYRAESILEGMAGDEIKGQRILIPRAMVARDILPDTLRERGALVDVVQAYQTVVPTGRKDRILEELNRGEIDCITFTSSSTVTNFVGLFESHEITSFPSATAIACIGPVTAKTARDNGLKVDITPSEYTIESLVAAICGYYGRGLQENH